MEQFLEKVEAYAAANGVLPTTVIQKAARLSGTTWNKWKDGTSMPNIRTMDRIKDYISTHPTKGTEQ